MLKIDFIYEVTDRIRNKMVGTCEVLIKRITHNKGQQLTGILFKKHGKESPLIYLDKYYDQYVDGRMSMVEIVDEIMRIQGEGGVQELIDIGGLADYEAVQSKIRLKLVNYEANKARLEGMPHVPFLDLAIMFYVEIDSNSQRILTAAVEHHHLEMWGIGKERIYNDALYNMRACCPVRIKSVMSVIKEVEEENDGNLDLIISEEDISHEQGFWIMTTKLGIQGASTLVHGDGLKKFAQINRDNIVILPSSIHEVMLIPQMLANGNYEYLSHMVEEVNRDEVLREDRLSNSIYLYNRNEDSITIAYRGPEL